MPNDTKENELEVETTEEVIEEGERLEEEVNELELQNEPSKDARPVSVDAKINQEKIISNLTEKILMGDLDLESVEQNKAQKWAYAEVAKRVRQFSGEQEQNAKYEQLADELSQIKQNLSQQELAKEEEKASNLVKEFREQLGMSSKEFKEAYPEFYTEFKDLKDKLGTHKAALLSLNTVKATLAYESNNELRERMSIPSGGKAASSKPKVSSKAKALGAAMGITEEDYNELL